MTIADGIQIAVLLVTSVGVWLAFRQLKEVSRSLRLARQGNTVNVIAHCASRYEAIMSTIPKEDDNKQGKGWWYRYWDLWTEEFNFFCKGLLDPDIFELWMNELVTVYQNPPYGQQWMGTRSEAHKEYLQSTLPSYRTLHSFFKEVDNISTTKDAEARARLVHNLIVTYSPSTSPFAISRNDG